MFKPYLTLYPGLFCTKYLVSKHEKIIKLKIFQCDRLRVINFGNHQFKVQKKQNRSQQIGVKCVRDPSETSLTPKSAKTGYRKNVLALMPENKLPKIRVKYVNFAKTDVSHPKHTY